MAMAVTLLVWPGWEAVTTGLDPSWRAGTALAFVQHVQWGPALDFTYGPYGFAGFLMPLYRSTALIAVGFVFVVTWVLAALLVHGLRNYWPGRHWGLAAAGVVTWALVSVSLAVTRADDFSGVAGLGLGLCMLRDAGRSRVRTLVLATGLAALCGFTLLVKADSGLLLLLLLVLALIGGVEPSAWHRVTALSAGALAVAFAAAWALAGQDFSDLVSFGRGSLSALLGYSSAVGGNLPSPSVAWWAWAVGIVAAAAFALGLRGHSAREKWTGSLMTGSWGWETVKEGFVTGDHFELFFRVAVIAVGLTSLLCCPRFVLTVALALTVFVAWDVSGTFPGDQVAGPPGLVDQLADIAQQSRFTRLTESIRAGVIKDEHLKPGVISALVGKTLTIEPWEDLVAWAVPGGKWDPEPVLQSYSAYSVYLDHIDAAFLSSGEAPQRALMEAYAYDHGAPSLDPPATMEALYCRYAQVMVSGRWQVLRRVPDRCGSPRRLSTVHARFGQPVAVPSDRGAVVVASFSFAQPLLSRLASVVLRPPAMYIQIQAADGRTHRYRFVPGTAGDAHVVSAPAALRYSEPFTPLDARSVELSGDGWASGQGKWTVTFDALRFEPAQQGTGRLQHDLG